jgi:hypothetical protein
MKSRRNIGCMNELGHGIMIRDHWKLLKLEPLLAEAQAGNGQVFLWTRPIL